MDHHQIDCVFLTCFESELEVYAALLRPSGIRIHSADTLERAEFLLIVTGATVVLTDELFLDGSWVEAANLVARLHPRVGLVVVLPAEDNVARTEALRGGCGSLSRNLFAWGPSVWPSRLRINALRSEQQFSLTQAPLELPDLFAPQPWSYRGSAAE